MTEPTAELFDPTVPLPPGITVLEASAGTGKTHTVASIAVRAVATGLPLDQLLLVTFTRLATGELRDRVWKRLSSAERELHTYLESGRTPDDEVVASLAAHERPVVVEHHRNLRNAVANFDGATIATIHSFCQQILSGIGLAGDVDRDPTFLENPVPVLSEVVDDLLLAKRLSAPTVEFTRKEALTIAELLVTNPDAAIVPEPDTVDRRTPVGIRVGFAERFRSDFDRRKRAMRVLTYDDLLSRLVTTLEGEVGGEVQDRLQSRFRLIAVDEFQDTDTVQWNMLTKAFGEHFVDSGGDTTRLVLIGDPKQAIYAFRGADVHTYLLADQQAAESGLKRTLGTNWRSDRGLLTALDALFGEAPLGAGIGYRKTVSAPHHVEPRLVGGNVANTPMRIRMVPRGDGPRAAKPMPVGKIKTALLDDLAREIVCRLESGAHLVDRAPDNSELGRRAVAPGDMAVLVRDNWEADEVRQALEAAGVPAVIHGAGSVYGSDAARDWLCLLDALDRPSSSQRARAVALTAFFGWTAVDVDVAGDDAWETMHTRLATWSRVLADRGVTALADTVAVETGCFARLLGSTHGDRRVTDLRHVAELLHAHGQATGSTSALSGWLRGEIRDATRDDSAQTRRLETDAEAVQVLTVHRAKGLEFPFVYLPFAWRRRKPRHDPPVFHDPGSERRCIDVGGPPRGRPDRPAAEERAARQRAEDDAEDLRLAYVAMTRPRHQLVIWWGVDKETGRSPLARLALGRDGSQIADVIRSVGTDDDVRAAFDRIVAASDGTVAIERVETGTQPQWSGLGEDDGELRARDFDREIDRIWARTSYSSLTAAAYEQHRTHSPERDERGVEDEQLGDEVPVPTAPEPSDLEIALRARPSTFGEMAGGARFGTLVHAALEHTDFTVDDLGGAIRQALRAQHIGRFVELDEDVLVDALCAAVETPLGPLAEGVALRNVEAADRLDEMSFELPLAGGDRPRHGATLAAMADVFERTVPADDPLAGYHEHLADPALAAELRGFLTGSIDLVLRLADRDRFLVVDHKSNWLGVPGEPLSAWHYRPEAMATAMIHAHYPLQAMLYSVALHRFLRWRLPAYDPDQHLGGVLYLFLRGMLGADNPTVDGWPCGVFSWRPPSALTTELSDLLDAHDADPVGVR